MSLVVLPVTLIEAAILPNLFTLADTKTELPLPIIDRSIFDLK